MTEKQKERVKELRSQWQSAKNLLTESKISEIQAIISTHGLNISNTGYMVCAVQMANLGLSGIPYLDCKTFAGWKKSGFCVDKGQKSQISGITWVSVGKKESDPESKGFMFPKGYSLFHRSQVKEL